MNNTIYLGSEKIDEKSFFIDVLYFSATSYSKSLYPTIERYFKKKAIEYFKGGSYTSTSEKIAETGKLDGVITWNIYIIMRTTYTLKN